MFDKKLLLQHIKNQDINEQYTSVSGKPMTAREKYAEYQKQDAIKAEKPKAREKMEMDALRKTTSSDAYRNASEEERSNMLDKSMELRSVGDNPSMNMSDAEYNVAQDVRGENIRKDTRAKLDAMSPEERQAEFDRVNTKFDQDKEARYQRGRKAAQGGKLSSMNDVRAMGDYFASNRRDYKKVADPIMAAARKDIDSSQRYAENRTDAEFERLKQGNLRGMRFDPRSEGEPNKMSDAEIRDRKEFIMQDQGVNIFDPKSVQAERERRQVLAGQTRVGLEALRRRRTGFGTPTTAGSSGRF